MWSQESTSEGVRGSDRHPSAVAFWERFHVNFRNGIHVSLNEAMCNIGGEWSDVFLGQSEVRTHAPTTDPKRGSFSPLHRAKSWQE